MELNDLRIVNCLRKSEVSIERIPYAMSLKNWRSMAYSVCHASVQMTSYKLSLELRIHFHV